MIPIREFIVTTVLYRSFKHTSRLVGRSPRGLFRLKAEKRKESDDNTLQGIFSDTTWYGKLDKVFSGGISPTVESRTH